MKISQAAKLILVVSLISAFGNLNAMEEGLEEASKRMSNCKWFTTIQEGSIEKIKALITLEEDVNEDCGRGCTPLHLAASFNPNPTIIKLLLTAGADPTAKITAGEFKGKTPYETASDPEVKKAFLTHAYPEEIQHIMPMIAAFKKAKKPLTFEDFTKIVALSLVDDKVLTARLNLSGYSADQLRKEIETGVIEAVSRSKCNAKQ